MPVRVEFSRPEGPWPPICPPALTDPGIVEGYLQDSSRLMGSASVLYRPSDEAEVAGVLFQASREGLPVTVVARQTSTTGSSVPQGGAILSMEKLTRFHGISGSRACAEAGIILGEFQRAVEREGWIYPPDPTSRNDCTLGASVACNASGARTFKYGPTRKYVRRIRVVLPDGSVLDLPRGRWLLTAGEPCEIHSPGGSIQSFVAPTYPLPQVKHAAGYFSSNPLDLIDLFIGSEGTLGVITVVEVDLVPRPAHVLSFLAAWSDPQQALNFVKLARVLREKPGTSPRCLEWLDEHSLRLIAQRFPEPALPATARAAVFFEQECLESEVDQRLEDWFDLLTRSCALLEEVNGVILAQSAAQQQLLYDLRHAVPAGLNELAAAHGMPKVGTDLAVPDEHLDAMMHRYSEALEDIRTVLNTQARLEVLREILNVNPTPSQEGTEGILRELERAAGRFAEGSSPEARVDALWEYHRLPVHFDYATFGHIGDNHVHINILPRSQNDLVVARKLYEALTLEAIARGGTVSGEHGIGKIKRKGLLQLFGQEAVAQMQAVKRAFDPTGILGRGNLFEAS